MRGAQGGEGDGETLIVRVAANQSCICHISKRNNFYPSTVSQTNDIIKARFIKRNDVASLTLAEKVDRGVLITIVQNCAPISG